MDAASPGGRRFQLLKQLGTGAYGAVYLAEQASPGGFRRRVALKVLAPSLSGRGAREAGRRMRDEARLLGLIRHKHIVEVVDLVRLEQGYAIVMEVILGPDLERVLEALTVLEAVVPVRAALEIAVAVADALHAAHQATDSDGNALAVVHRDIKPSNILITADGDVKVLDFGVASMRMDDREGKTGLMVGTLRYMAPERVRREADGQPGDVYALAATLVELLTGTPMGSSPVAPERHALFVDEVVAGLTDRLTNADNDVLDLIRASLSEAPTLRPSPAAFAHAVRQMVPRWPESSRLSAFAQAIVPRVDELVGGAGAPVNEVLSEASTGHSGGGAALVASGSAVRSSARRWVGIAAAMALGGLLVFGLTIARRMAPAAPPVAVRVPVPLPVPVLAPVPAPPETPSVTPALARSVAAPVAPVVPVPDAPVPVMPAPAAPVIPAPVPAPVVPAPVVPAPVLPAAGAPVAARLPPAAPVPNLTGVWTGKAAGRPLSLTIDASEGPGVRGSVAITLGTTVRTIVVTGSLSSGQLVLAGADGERFDAALAGQTLTGSFSLRDGARVASWRATRP